MCNIIRIVVCLDDIILAAVIMAIVVIVVMTMTMMMIISTVTIFVVFVIVVIIIVFERYALKRDWTSVERSVRPIALRVLPCKVARHSNYRYHAN